MFSPLFSPTQDSRQHSRLNWECDLNGRATLMVYKKEWAQVQICPLSRGLTVEEAVSDGATRSDREALALAVRLTLLARVLQNLKKINKQIMEVHVKEEREKQQLLSPSLR